MKKTITENRSVGLKKAAMSASVLALTLMLGACATKRGDDSTDTTAAIVGTEVTTASEVTTSAVTTTADVATTAAVTTAAETTTAEVTTTEEAVTTTVADETSEGTEADTNAGTEPGETEPQATEVDRNEYVVKLDSIDVSEYLDFSKLKDLEIKKSDTVVSDDVLMFKVADGLVNEFKFELEEVDRPVQYGDTVTIDYKGFMGDVAFDGGEAEDYDLGIGSEAFIPGFESGIVGKKAGDSFDLPVTFPEQYHEEFAGKNAVFKVTIKKVRALPEVKDEDVKEKSEGKYETYQAYYDAVAGDLNKSKHKEVVYNKIMDAIEMKKDHEGLINEYVQDQYARVDQMGAMYGMDRASYLSAMGYDEASFTETLNTNGKNYAKQKLAIYGVCRELGITVSPEEIDELKVSMIEEYELGTEEVLMEYITLDELEFQVYYDKFLKYVEEFKTTD